MEIVLKDRDGNDILSPTLTQWDQGVPIEIRDFYYNPEFVFLHFYNSTKQAIYSPETQFNATAHTITAEVPNQLLREPYPITVHVYKSDGGSATDPDEPVHAQTVFTATINVEPRMKPDDFEEIDNAGSVSAKQVQEDLGRQIANWETRLSAWADDISDAVNDCNQRSDRCEEIADELQVQYDNELASAKTSLRDEFNDSLDGCVVRIENTAPTSTSYGTETQPVITFVIAEE